MDNSMQHHDNIREPQTHLARELAQELQRCFEASIVQARNADAIGQRLNGMQFTASKGAADGSRTATKRLFGEKLNLWKLKILKRLQ